MSEANNHKTISFIIPTVGRESLKTTLASIETWPGDEVLVIQHNSPSGNWGNKERQEGTDKAKRDQNHRWADFAFINCWLWPAKKIIWRNEAIALIGSDDEKYEKNINYSEYKKIRSGKWGI